MSELLYDRTTQTLMKQLEEKRDGINETMLYAVLYKLWKHHPAKIQCTFIFVIYMAHMTNLSSYQNNQFYNNPNILAIFIKFLKRIIKFEIFV